MAKRNYKKRKLSVYFSVFLVLYGLLAVFYSIYMERYEWIFWFCYAGMILIGLGSLIKSPKLIIGQLNIIFIPLLFWNIDFFLTLFSGKNYLGIADYFFEEMPILSRIISLEHLFLIPISLFLLYQTIESNKDFRSKIKYSWLISIFQVSITFFIMRMFNLTKENINCISENCYKFIPLFTDYLLGWFIVMFAMIFLTNLLVRIYFSINQK